MFSAAHALETSAVYRAEGLNMVLLEAKMDLKADEQAYDIHTKATAKGVLALFIHAQTEFETKGRIVDEEIQVDESVMKTKDNKKIVRIPQNFTDKPEYLDYQSLLLHLLRIKEPETHTVLASDGKRDMRITLIYDGQKELSSVYKRLKGSAHKWSVRIDVIGGKKNGWFFERMREGASSPLSLYIKENEQGEKSLVLGVFDTGVIGQLFVVKDGEK